MTISYDELKISLPYLDQASGDVKYTEFEGATAYDSNSARSDCGNWVALFAWLNKLNPDWQRIKAGTPEIYSGLEGEGYIDIDKPSTINGVITEQGSYVDKWWGSDVIAKWGVIGFVTDGFIEMPLQWVNTNLFYIKTPDPSYNQIYYNFQPGVKADLAISKYPNDSSAISNVPYPSFYSSHFSMPFMPPNQTPFNYGNHEVLP